MELEYILSVYVQDANLSVGDVHFSQGDGEPNCVVEMAGIATLKVHGSSFQNGKAWPQKSYGCSKSSRASSVDKNRR